MTDAPLIELRDIRKSFGGVHRRIAIKEFFMCKEAVSDFVPSLQYVAEPIDVYKVKANTDHDVQCSAKTYTGRVRRSTTLMVERMSSRKEG